MFISQHKAFAEVFLDDSHTPSNRHVSLTVSAPVLGVAMRFPIPDLRSDQERGPWFKKSLQKEILHLELEDLEIKTEFKGGSSPDQTKMELTFRELTGMSPEVPHCPLKHSDSQRRKILFLHFHREVPGRSRSPICPVPQSVPHHGWRNDDI